MIFVFCFLLKVSSVDAPENKEPCENKLICQERHNASAGENVTLDCHTEPQCDVMDKSVKWEFGSEIVLLYRNKDVDPGAQAERFKRRAKKDITWNPAEGKLAVKIESVKTTDFGEYTCSIRKGKVCTTELILKQLGNSDKNEANKPQTTPSQSQKNIGVPPFFQDPVITLVLATFALLYLLCH